ncbi:prephenate dehydratase domain-containing protein, partial [Bacillus altitudinis]|uniref:prephenate dehydratase domain-containing protein n=1 Tax=Bacillus altitudinis TaxID=293387 RepID=UPI003B525363
MPQSMHPVSNGQVHFPLLPLQNPLQPSLNLTIHYLIHHHPFSILPQITPPIPHHLLLHPSTPHTSHTLHLIHSHPHPIPHSHQFLNTHFPHIPHPPLQSTPYTAKYIT